MLVCNLVCGESFVLMSLLFYHQRENGCLQLLASKGSTVIVFNISTVNGRLIEMPQHSFVSGIHSVGISGLGCSQNGLVTTCSTEGTVQSFSLGEVKIILQHTLELGYLNQMNLNLSYSEILPVKCAASRMTTLKQGPIWG